MHSNYIWMINLLQCHYFTLHRLSFHAVIELHFLINLYCTFFHSCLMIAYINNCKGALANSLADLVVFKQACLTRMCTWLQKFLRTLTSYMLIFKIQMTTRVACCVAIDTLWCLHVVGDDSTWPLSCLQSIEVQRLLRSIWVYWFYNNDLGLLWWLCILLKPSRRFFILVTTHRHLRWSRTRCKRPVSMRVGFGIAWRHLGMSRLAVIRRHCCHVTCTHLHAVRSIIDFMICVSSTQCDAVHGFHTSFVRSTVAMEDILEFLGMLVAICLGWGVGVLLALRECILYLILFVAIYSLLLISLTILILDTFRNTALTFNVCVEWLFDGSLHVTI